jgi:hypothetical protein
VGGASFNASFSLYGIQQDDGSSAETISPLSTPPQSTSKSFAAENIGLARSTGQPGSDEEPVKANTVTKASRQAESVTPKPNRIQRSSEAKLGQFDHESADLLDEAT